MSAALEQPQRVWRATERQHAFLRSSAFEALYGGAAGGGKTDALVLGALYDIAHPSYNAIILRRTYPELRKVVRVSQLWYPACGGKFNEQKHQWRFPSGAIINFGHLQHDSDALQYQGDEFSYIGFDELTHFTEYMYTQLISRCRSAAGLIKRVRAGTNPGGPGHEWVMKRWGPWLNPQSAVRAEPGQMLRYRVRNDETEWLDEGPLSRVFFPALLSDNPHLAENDPQYIEQLQAMDRVSRARLLDGNWLIQPAAGAYYQRGWFTFVDNAPANVVARVRRWDLASTEDGDWTVGARMSLLDDGRVCIEDVVRIRARPHGVRACVLSTAAIDPRGTTIVIPQDPGQAGVDQREAYASLLAGFTIRFVRETGDKTERQNPFSAQVESRRVLMVRAPWNEPVMQCLEAFPDAQVHDDDLDALAGGFTYLTANSNATYIQAVRLMAAQHAKGHAA